MTFFTFNYQGLALRGQDVGEGPALLFQHGLGGDEAQVADVMPAEGYRRLTLECRAQGQSQAGPYSAFLIPQFTDDILAYADQRGIDRFVVGGISMGAAIALRIAVIAPQRVKALVLARPAWNWNSAPANMAVFAELCTYIERQDREGFAKTKTAKHFSIHAPDNLASFYKMFDRKDAATTVELLSRIAISGPEISEADVKAIKVPTLILANRIDLVHPLLQAETLASAIPLATLLEIAPKAENRELHTQQFRHALRHFLDQQGHQP